MEQGVALINSSLPKIFKDVSYFQDILTLGLDGGIISIRCPFEVLIDGALVSFPGGSSKIFKKFFESSLDHIAITNENLNYPGLIIQTSKGIITVRPDAGGEEMWLLDFPGVAFVTP